MNSPARLILPAYFILACLLIGDLYIVLQSPLGLFSFRDVTGTDSAVFLRVGELVHHGYIYPDSLNKPPYYITIYGPLTYLIFSVPFRLAEALSLDPVLLCRLAVFVSFCLSVLAVWLICRRISNSLFTASLSVVFALSSIHLGFWMATIRGDFLGIAFSLFAVYLFLLTKNSRWVLLSAIVAGLALGVKQTFIAPAATIVVWLLYRRCYRQACYWAAAFVAVAGAIYGLIWLHEPFMGQHLAALRHPIYEFHDGVRIIGKAFVQPMAPFAVAALALVFSKRSPSEWSSPELKLLAFYCLASWLIACATIPHQGGGINYFYEGFFVAALLAAPAFQEVLVNIAAMPTAIKALLYCVCLCWLIPQLEEDGWYLKQQIYSIKNYRRDKAAFTAFADIIKGHRFISTYSDLTLLSQEPLVPDPGLNNELELGGQWSYAPIADRLDRQYFEFVALRSNISQGYRGHTVWDGRMIQSLKAQYHLACVLPDIEIWMPNGADSELLPKLLAAGCQPPSKTALP